MQERLLSPEARLDLQIQLDRVRAVVRECERALFGLVEGTLTRRDYLDLVARQSHAQRAWERRHRKYFAELSG